MLALMSLCGNLSVKFSLGKCFSRRVGASSLPCGPSLWFVSSAHGARKSPGALGYQCRSVTVVEESCTHLQNLTYFKKLFLFNMVPFQFFIATFTHVLILSTCFSIPVSHLVAGGPQEEGGSARRQCVLPAGVRLPDHLRVFRSRGKVKAVHCKEVLRELRHTECFKKMDLVRNHCSFETHFIFFSLISLFPFFPAESPPQPLVLASRAVARRTVNVADVILLQRVVLKPCGSAFSVPIFGMFSAFVIFPVSFLYPAASSCG